MATVEEHGGDTQTTSADEATLGSALRKAREQQGLSVADVVSQIKLAPSQIEALESEAYEKLPEMAFVRGFVRSYAKLLHLDVLPLLALLPSGNNDLSIEDTPMGSTLLDSQSPEQKKLIRVLGIVFLLVLVVIIAAWQLTTADEKRCLI